MRIDNSFAVDAPVERVWDTLVDLKRVAPCMPGAELADGDETAGYEGRFRIKVGPVSTAYRGRIEITRRDDARREVVLRGSGSDTGGGTATAVISGKVADRNGSSQVHISTELDVTGRLAQFGGRKSLSQSVADRIVGQFAERLRQELSNAAASEADSVSAAASEPHAVRAQTAVSASKSEPLNALDLAGGLAAERLVRPRVLTAMMGLGAVAIVILRRRRGHSSRPLRMLA
jgi:hypothetical protein